MDTQREEQVKELLYIIGKMSDYGIRLLLLFARKLPS